MAKKIPPKVLLRQLFIDLSNELPKVMDFKSIANLFYKYGVINTPESPYGIYPGSKREYILERLNQASNLELFLTEGIEELTWMASVGVDESIDDSHIRWVLKKLGYSTVLESEEHGITYYRAPKNILDKLKIVEPGAIKRIDPAGLPTKLATLVNELNLNLELKNYNAAALLLRRILTYACFVALSKKGLDKNLVSKSGESKELSSIIEICKQEYRLPSQSVGRVTSVKWIGDSANHSYSINITEADVESSVTSIRLFIDEIGIRNSQKS